MPPPPKPRKKSPPGAAGGSRPRGKKRPPKKKPNPMTAQLVGGVTLLALFGVLVVVGVYVAQKAMPTPKPTPTPKGAAITVVPRPSIDPVLDSQEPKRPGLKLAPPDEVYAPRAKDVAKDSPLDPPVNGLLGRGVLTVFADGKFRPNDLVPRAEFVVWCYNAVMAQTEPGPDPFVSPKKGFPTVEPTGDEFKDVPADYWAAPVLASAKQSGVFESVLDKSFRPDAPLTREEWAGFAADIAIAKDVRAKLPDTLDATKLAVALRKLNYTDPQAVKDPYRGPVFLIANDDKRRSWISDTFTPPENPGPWGPTKFVTRGEAAAWLGGAYDQVGLGLM